MDTKERKRTARPASGKTGTADRPVRPRKAAPKKPAPAKKPVARKAPVKQRPPRSTDKQPAPEIVYTEPGLFNRSRLILRIATVAAIVLALIFGISIFFKVETVTVIGNEKYTSGEVLDASGIRIGENLLGLNNAKISSNIIAELPYVGQVRVGIKLPNTVKIEIKELDVVYSIEADDGSWWLVRSDGVVIEKTNSADAELYTKILGVKITGAEVGKKVTAAQPPVEETLEDGQPAPITVKAEEQLDVAISLMQYLEDFGVIGEAKSIDVSNMADLEIWYQSTRFQVKLGDSTDLMSKVSNMKKAINTLSDTDTGILDVSSLNEEGGFNLRSFSDGNK